VKKWRLVIAISCMLTLTGCIKKNEISETDSAAVAEYIAGVMLKNDKNYEEDLILPGEDVQDQASEEAGSITSPPQELSITPTPTPLVDQNSNGGVAADNTELVSNASLSEVIGANDFDIAYLDYQLCETYPEDETNSYFSLTPRNGAELLVASFSVKNTTQVEKRLNLSSTKIVYQLDINTGTFSKPLLTLLENDLQYIDVTVKPGKTKNVHLIFEVSKEAKIQNMNLIISRDDKTEIVKIK